MDYLIDGKMPEAIAKQIVDIEKQIAVLKAKQDEIKGALRDAMKSAGIIKVDNEYLTISYIAPTTSERLDSKELKKDLPDIYDAYCTITDKADYIKIKIKE